MEVSSFGDWFWELHASCINSLENALQIDATGHFLDKHGGQTVFAEFIENAEEVDLAHAHGLVIDAELERHAGDEADQLVVLLEPDPDVPVRLVVGHEQSPAQEFNTVVEAEVALFVLHIVLREQSVELR